MKRVGQVLEEHPGQEQHRPSISGRVNPDTLTVVGGVGGLHEQLPGAPEKLNRRRRGVEAALSRDYFLDRTRLGRSEPLLHQRADVAADRYRTAIVAPLVLR